QPSAPKSIFAMSQCTSDSDGFLTIGCLARGFSPADSLTFKWKDFATNELSDFVQYPAFGRDGDYTKISHLRVRKSDWDPQKPYTCEASNSKGSKNIPVDQRADVYLTVPTKMELDNGTATFMCLAQRFSPKTYAFKWFQDGKEVTDAIDKYDKSEKKGSVTKYSATSILQISADKWKQPNSKVKCEFVHKAGNEDVEAEYAGKNPKKPTVFILAPPEHKPGEPMTLTCYVKDFYPKEVFVSWLADDEPVTLGYSYNTSLPIQNDKYFSVYSQLTVDYSEWKSGTVFSCVVYHESIDEKMRVLTRSIADNIDKAGVINLSMNTPHPLYDTIDTDDSGIANTAVTFVFLFLITLLYSIGATFVKVYNF
uniref:Ig-like domain-containing protein n=1 Tax=Sinocyclocheilus rhinocerous TaxID=307959 RepID=A0A673MAB7_9TELE